MRKLIPPRLFFLFILLMTALHATLPTGQFIRYPYTLLGLIPLVAGIYVSAWHSRLFRSVGTNIQTFEEPDQFVRTGMFTYTRNPMYLGFLIALMGVAMLLGSLVSFLFPILFFVIANNWYIAFEEQTMARKFGNHYREYQSRVRRWI